MNTTLSWIQILTIIIIIGLLYVSYKYILKPIQMSNIQVFFQWIDILYFDLWIDLTLFFSSILLISIYMIIYGISLYNTSFTVNLFFRVRVQIPGRLSKPFMHEIKLVLIGLLNSLLNLCPSSMGSVTLIAPIVAIWPCWQFITKTVLFYKHGHSIVSEFSNVWKSMSRQWHVTYGSDEFWNLVKINATHSSNVDRETYLNCRIKAK